MPLAFIDSLLDLLKRKKVINEKNSAALLMIDEWRLELVQTVPSFSSHQQPQIVDVGENYTQQGTSGSSSQQQQQLPPPPPQPYPGFAYGFPQPTHIYYPGNIPIQFCYNSSKNLNYLVNSLHYKKYVPQIFADKPMYTFIQIHAHILVKTFI